jgi:BolA protein
MGAVNDADKELTNDQNGASRAQRMRQALESAFRPARLTIENESARHAGHAGASASGETHFRVRMVAAAFKGVARVARQRMVNAALAREFETGLHALSLELKSPEEAEDA